MADAPRVNPWIVACAVMASTFMVVLDSTVVNVSLPYIAGDLSATIDEATWTLTAYLAANAVILPMTGWLGSLLGRKRLLLLSTAGFTLTSLLCGLAPSMPVLVVLRILQGLTGGTLQPISQAILHRSVPAGGSRQGHELLGPRRRRRADPRARARRLAHRQLLVALGVLHQHPGGRRSRSS